MRGRPIAGVVLAAAVVFGGLSLWLGQDVNWDLLNYHYYDGYAFLHSRLDRDIAPAGLQTYQPPLLHVFHYLGLAHLPSRVYGFLLGALHGLNVPLLFVLGLTVLGRAEPAAAVAMAAAALGGIGPGAFSMLGTSFGDNLVTLPALLALLIVLRQARENGPPDRPSGVALLGAGLLAGIATGLKLTMGAFHLALFVAAAFALWKRGLGRGMALLGLGSFLGFAPTGGVWAWTLFRCLGNPVFPFANGLFRSPYYRPEDFTSSLYATRTPFDLVRPAVDLALGRTERLQEVAMRDGRLLLLLLVALVAIAFVTLGRFGRAGGRWASLDTRGKAFLFYWVTGYLSWALLLPPYYRYFVLLEMTAPLLLFMLLSHLVPGRHLTRVVLAMALALALTTRTGSWGRRSWQDGWLQMPVPPRGLQPNSMVVLVGQPISFAIPSFLADASFVHLTAVEAFGVPEKWNERIEQAVARHRGPFLLLSNFEFSRAAGEAQAAAFGLQATPDCDPIQRGPLRLRICELRRQPGFVLAK